MKKTLFLLPLMIGLLASCNPPGPDVGHNEDDDEGDPTPVLVESVSLSKKTLTLDEGSSATLTYTVSPSNADNKDVVWESSDAIVASVENGVVKAWNAGTADISVTTIDGEKKDTCRVTVKKNVPEKSLVKDEFALNSQGYSFDNKSLVNYPLAFNDYEISFTVGGNTYNNQPAIIKSNKRYEARVYWGNTMTFTSGTNTLAKIEFDLGANDKGNTMTCSAGEIIDGAWYGESKEVTFTIGGKEGYRAFETFRLCYEGQSEDNPDVFVNLGQMSIAEVKQYIKDHPVKKNSYGNGVNENRLVTIRGLAMAKIDLIKYTAKFGLDVSEHGKVIMADETGSIGVATVVNNLGTSLWGKLGDHACESTSKYVVSGYLSEYLGHPEILVATFAWDTSLDVTLDYSKISTDTVTLEEFYTKAQNVNYNCAGHGYGDVVTIENLKCYYVEPDGQGKRYYNFTDGTRSIRVNAFNLGMATEGNVYDVTGIISLKNLSPIIVAFKITSKAKTVDFDYESAASSISIAELKAIHGSQDDTSTRYPDVVAAYGNIYKTTGYMVAVVENGKLYVGISDTPRSTVITGKTNAMANYNVVLIKNENFWNTTEDELYLFNPIYDDYLCEDKEIEIFYVTRQLEYSDKKPMWEILLIPEFVESLYPVEE